MRILVLPLVAWGLCSSALAAEPFGAARLGEPAKACLAGDAEACKAAGDAVVELTSEYGLARPWFDQACELGLQAACAWVALQDDAIYTYQEEAEDRPEFVAGLDPIGSGQRACERGDLASCMRLSDVFGECKSRPSGLPSVDDPDYAQYLHAWTHDLAVSRCIDLDAAACAWLGRSAIGGCDEPEEVAIGLEWLARAVEVRGSLDDETCLEVMGHVPPADAIGPIPARTVTTSSTQVPYKDYLFDAGQLVDGDLGTSWQPATTPEGGKGAWIYLTFGGLPEVTGLSIANGFQREDALGDLFTKNSRIRNGTVTFEDGASETFELDPTARGKVTVTFAGHVTGSVLVTVDEVEPGTRWKDLAVSEIGAVGRVRPAVLVAGCKDPSFTYGEVCRTENADGHLELCDAVSSAEPPNVAPALPPEAELAARCDRPPNSGSECSNLVLAMLARKAPAEEIAAVAERWCARGDSEMCASLGCRSSEGRAGMPELAAGAAAACQRMCDSGDAESCVDLVLAKLERADYSDKLGLDPEGPTAKALYAKIAHGCTDAADCLKKAKVVEWEMGYPKEVLAMVAEVAFTRRACTFGSGEACHDVALAFEAGSWQEAHPLAAKYKGLACDAGFAPACIELVDANAPDADARLTQADKLDGADCDKGVEDACARIAVRMQGEADKEKEAHAWSAKLEALQRADCDKGDSDRCLAAAQTAALDGEDGVKRARLLREKAIGIAGRACAELSGPCTALCAASASLAGSEQYAYPTMMSGARPMFDEAAAYSGGMCGDLLFSMCGVQDAIAVRHHGRN